MADESLSKKWIIRSRSDFENLFQTGRRTSGKFVFINFLPAPETVSFQVGFVCGKKIGNAVTRNLYKRRMREVIRKNKVCFHGLKCVIVATPAISKSDFQSLQQDILNTLSQIKK